MPRRTPKPCRHQDPAKTDATENARLANVQSMPNSTRNRSPPRHWLQAASAPVWSTPIATPCKGQPSAQYQIGCWVAWPTNESLRNLESELLLRVPKCQELHARSSKNSFWLCRYNYNFPRWMLNTSGYRLRPALEEWLTASRTSRSRWASWRGAGAALWGVFGHSWRLPETAGAADRKIIEETRWSDLRLVVARNPEQAREQTQLRMRAAIPS